MRIMIFVTLVLAFLSFMVSAKDAAKKSKSKKIVPVETTAATPTTAPCDSKEDILKKLEAEKKAKEAGEKPKAFSLQGNNTGCSVK